MSEPTESGIPGLPWIDWEVAAATGRRLVRPGPEVSEQDRAECIADLRDAARRAPALVAAAADLPLTGGDRDLVIDRTTWITGNAQTSSRLLALVSGDDRRPRALARRVGGRAFGVQVGAAMAVLATRVLGQFDPFAEQERLLLVAPNILQAERDLHLVGRDFRLWVVLHEQTHRVQFANAPWLRGYLLDLLREALLAESTAGADLGELIKRSAQRVSDEESSAGLIGALIAPEARDSLDRIIAVMSLVEGHADVMMDRAGPDVIPTLATIRARFEKRRDRRGLQALVGRLLGLDVKLAQYRDGAAFCNAVISAVGVPALNRAFTGREYLPTLAEMHDPLRWLARTGD